MLRAIPAMALASTVAACSSSGAPPDANDRPESALAIAVAPLELVGVGRAEYAITVSNATGVVWSQDDLDSDRYGDGKGSLSYVGPCDASVPEHTVTLLLKGLYEDDGTLIPAGSYQNPTPVSVKATCVKNADTPVPIDLTILRDADQGFFDIAVNFADVFCSAKLDCEDDDGHDLDLLHRPGGPRDLTVVLALACTGGPGGETNLYLDDLAVTCTSPTYDFSIDTSGGPGNVTPLGNVGGLAFAAAIYRGDEASNGVSYWNAAVGLDETRFGAAGTCRLVTKATASDHALPGNTTPPSTTWPVIHWDVTLVSGGARACTRDQVNVEGSGVQTGYTDLGPGVSFDHGYANGGDTTTSGPPGCPGCTLDTFAPTAIPTAASTSVTLRGAFAAAGACTDCELQAMPAGTPIPATFDSAAGTITFTAPAGSEDVAVRFVVGLDVVPQVGFEVDGSGRVAPFSHATVVIPRRAPTVTAASGCVDDEYPRALSCDVAGQAIDVRGADFGTVAGDIAVTVGGEPCTNVSLLTPHTKLRCNLAAGAGFDLDVVVTVDGRSGTLAGGVSYFGPGTGAVTCTGCGPGGTLGAGATLQIALAPPMFSLAGVDLRLEHGPLSFPCAIDFAHTTPLSVTCQPPAEGVGADLAVMVYASGLESRPSVARFRYPAPILVDGTIAPAVGVRNGGDWFTVDARQAGLDARVMSLAYGPYTCARVTAADLGGGVTRVGCLTVPGAGGPHRVQLAVDGQASAVGLDGFTYPMIPVITSVRGCPTDAYPRTAGCPTAGGTTVEVSGSGFAPDAVVWLDDSPCPGSTYAGPTSLQCVLPAGTGDRRVTVRAGLIDSLPLAAGVAYAAPTITKVSGCTDLGPTTYDCAPGTNIAIAGHDFGPNPSATVGGAACAPLTALGPGLPFDLGVKCQLPAGAGLNVEVRAFNGHVSAPAFVSYAP